MYIINNKNTKENKNKLTIQMNTGNFNE